MAKERKIKCDCGEFLIEKSTKFGHFETEAIGLNSFKVELVS